MDIREEYIEEENKSIGMNVTTSYDTDNNSDDEKKLFEFLDKMELEENQTEEPSNEFLIEKQNNIIISNKKHVSFSQEVKDTENKSSPLKQEMEYDEYDSSSAIMYKVVENHDIKIDNDIDFERMEVFVLSLDS